ncbi:MAG: hypothetical protein EPO61_01155 [Nitrospirae bacterium]|nr:MAG: hypothetical protein EPO61_01155 [Nitrospirota bacterium]
MGTAAPTLVFVESGSDIDRMRHVGDGRDRSLRIIALSPEAEYALEKAGLPFALADDYYTGEEITQAGIANYDRVDEFCAYVDAWFEQRSEIVKRFGLKPARFNVYPLKILFDAVSVRLIILRRILTQEKPVEVWAAPEEQGDHPLDPFLFFGASIFARLLPSVCASLGIPFRTWKIDGHCADAVPTALHDLVNPGRSRNRYTAAFHTCWPLIQDLGRGVSLSWRRRFSASRPELLVMDLNDREIRLVSASLMERGTCRLLYWSRRSRWVASLNPFRLMRLDDQGQRDGILRTLTQETATLWPELTGDPGFRRFLVWDGVDAFPVVESRLQHVFTELLVKAAELNLQARAMFDKMNIRVLLMSQVALYWQRAVCAAAKDCGLRVVNMQHGLVGERLCPIVYYTECEGVDDLLTYGTGMQDFCRRHYPHAAVPLPTGSPALDQLERSVGNRNPGQVLRRLGLAQGKKTVIYCPTSSTGNKLYVSFSYPKSDSQYFAIQRRIVETFRDYPALQFVVKQHVGMPRGFPLGDLMRDLRMDNCRVVVEEPSFVDLLAAADLVILDSPTMTFLETLAMGMPVLVFNNWFRWEPETLELLKQSAVYSNDFDEFIGILRGYLATERFEGASRDGSAFLRRFGTYKGDRRSADRAAEAIEKLAQTDALAGAGTVAQA